MSFAISVKAEILKTKRSASFWLSLIGAAVIPGLFFLSYILRPDQNYKYNWGIHITMGWQVFNAFLLPMFVILICSLIPQLEYKNNTWKQLFATPQSVGRIFFSKYTTIVIMICFLFLLFNILLFSAAVVPNLFYSKFKFLDESVNWTQVFRLNFKTLVSLLALISVQYWLSLRFRNFIVPIGIGLGLLVIGIILAQVGWKHVFKFPYAFPILTVQDVEQSGNQGRLLQNHELNSIGYFIFFTTLAFLDMRFRKERG